MPATRHCPEGGCRAYLRGYALVEHFFEVFATRDRRLLFVENGLSGPDIGLSGRIFAVQGESEHVWAVLTDTLALSCMDSLLDLGNELSIFGTLCFYSNTIVLNMYTK